MRLLFVAMANSVHTARWINQLADQGWDVHLFPVDDVEPHRELRNVTAYTLGARGHRDRDQSVRVKPLVPLLPRGRGAGAVNRVMIRLLPGVFEPAQRLARLIRRLRPDVVHSLEFQQAGYLTLEARRFVPGLFPPWISTNWGSDIYLFGRLAEHAGRIKEVLSKCDFYSCECCRDVQLARDWGFRGEVLPVIPNSGGFDLDHAAGLRSPGSTSQRRLVVLKGYQHWSGRALVGLRAVEMCARELQGYRVAVYSAVPDVRLAAELLAQSTGIAIDVVPACSHDDILRLFGQARVYLGLSISDGVSTSLLEALVMGAFPIQSCTSCADEWITSGQTGMVVPAEDPEVIAAALRRALTDDALVDRAAARNAQVVSRRLDCRVVRPEAIGFYDRVRARYARRAA